MLEASRGVGRGLYITFQELPADARRATWASGRGGNLAAVPTVVHGDFEWDEDKATRNLAKRRRYDQAD